MPGSPIANDKAIQRLMAEVDFQEVLLRLFDEEAPFYLADVTEISRRQAKKTPYGGAAFGREDPGVCPFGGGPAVSGEGDSLCLWDLLGEDAE